jgi:trk system potassium uptake protein TrkH
MATGGFSTRDASVLAFNSRYIEIVIMIFMFLGASSFSLHYIAWTRDIRAYFRDSQFRYYFAFTVGGIVIIMTTLYFTGTYGSIWEALRFGSFQSISIMTTTGFATADYDKWPYGVQLILLLFMFMGGSAGSTTSAIKTIRVVLLCKYAYREIARLIHPKIFATVKLGGRVIHKNALESISAFFIFYMLIFIVASLIVAGEGLSPIEAMSAVAATQGNVGPGLGAVGPTGNYFAIPILSKCVLIVCMIVGRLEIFTVLVLLTPGFWKR